MFYEADTHGNTRAGEDIPILRLQQSFHSGSNTGTDIFGSIFGFGKHTASCDCHSAVNSGDSGCDESNGDEQIWLQTCLESVGEYSAVRSTIFCIKMLSTSLFLQELIPLFAFHSIKINRYLFHYNSMLSPQFNKRLGQYKQIRLINSSEFRGRPFIAAQYDITFSMERLIGILRYSKILKISREDGLGWHKSD